MNKASQITKIYKTSKSVHCC